MQAFSSNAAGRVFLRLRGDWRVLKVFRKSGEFCWGSGHYQTPVLKVWEWASARKPVLYFIHIAHFILGFFLTKVYTESKYTGIAVKKDEQTVRQYQEDARRLN